MKKQYIYIPLNIILIIAVLFGIGFLIFNSGKNKEVKNPTSNNVSTSSNAKANDKLFTIGVVQHTKNKECDACYQGFIAKLAQNGYVNGDNIDVIYVLEESEKKCREEIQKIIDKKVDVIYSIGVFTTQVLKEMNTDIPVVFAAVSNPEGNGFVDSNESPKGNMTGVSSFPPTFEQIASVSFLLPDAQSVGVLYDATSEDSVIQEVIAENEVEESNSSLTFRQYPFTQSSEISDSLKEFLDDKTEVLFLPDDVRIIENIEEIMEFSLENNIPTICGNESMLPSGGFSCTKANYSSIGNRAADIVVEILVNSKKPSDIAVVFDYKCDTVVNKDIMEELGIELSEEAQKRCQITNF